MIQYQNCNFTVFQSLLFQTTSTVVQTDDCIIIVDPNLLPTEVKEIQLYVQKIKDEKPIYVIFTHSDWDHIVGYQAFPEATTIASEEFNNRTDKTTIIQQIQQFDDQCYLDRDYPILYPHVDIVVKDEGQVLDIGNTTLTFYKAEGHTNDGIYTIIEPLGLWIAGDYLSDIEFPFIYHSSEKYEETLRKTEGIIANHQIEFLIPGHGHITNIKEEIKFRKSSALTYIKELRESIQKKYENPNLLKGYKYLTELQTSHQENISLIKKELE